MFLNIPAYLETIMFVNSLSNMYESFNTHNFITCKYQKLVIVSVVIISKCVNHLCMTRMSIQNNGELFCTVKYTSC